MPGLIYVVGPSGAGKDSVLEWLRQRIPASQGVHFAQRCINRPVQAVSQPHESGTTHGSQGAHEAREAHEAVDTAGFLALLQQQAFAMHWTANCHHYGIRHAQLQGPPGTRWVLVNGSRGHLPQALHFHPDLHVLHITAPAHILAQRLQARGRESAAQIEARLQRAQAFTPSGALHHFEVSNDATLEDTGQRLLAALLTLPHWQV
jgi:ribose 1,5-bisphosphokinase